MVYLKEQIENLSKLKTVDATRELIQIYKDCQWRDTKFEILDSISLFPHQRSFQFLFEVALEQKDLPLSEKAIHCISSMDDSIRNRFLNHQYKHGPTYLKPAIIKALACIPDRSLAADFLNDLNTAIEQQQILLAKNLILALGEFKYPPAIQILFQIAANKKQRDLALSSIVSLGKILRKVDDFEKISVDYKNDSFENQIFTTALHQIQFRSEWKIEDYLQKFYNNESCHPAIFFEICSFPESEIRAGVDLFSTKENITKTLTLLSHLPHQIAIPYYEVTLGTTSDTDLIFQSISLHKNLNFKKMILSHQNIQNRTWLKCLTSTLPNADEIYKDIFTSKDYVNLSESEKMHVIQYFFDYIYIYTGESKKINHCGLWLESVLTQEKSPTVQARWIRLLADIKYENNSISLKILQFLTNKDLCASCLYYMKKNSHHSFTEALITHSNDIINSFKLRIQWIKALSGQNKDKSEDKRLLSILNELIKFKSDPINVEILKLLIKNPLLELKSYITECLNSKNSDLNLFSVIAIKKYNDENMTELISQHLNSKMLTLKGRALDSLLAQPGLRAKRLVIDFLRDNSTDLEICEKIIRCFVPPENSTEYFANIIEDILKLNPDHPLSENLIEFQSVLRQQIQSQDKTLFSSNEPDIQKIETDLDRKLPAYKFYDESAKSALRSAEVPFYNPEMYDRYIDKSAIILGYTKTIDIILEKQIGRKLLFPILEKRIFDFQNVVHVYSLNDDFPVAENVLKKLGLEKEFSAQSLPAHKMSLVAKSILNTKILNDHFKILDGLRAWSVVLLLFGRKTALQPKPLISVFSDEATVVLVAKKLMWLQDLRNPFAHRQTIIDFKALENVRAEVFQILNLLNQLFEKK
jgi:hypothetical protein